MRLKLELTESDKEFFEEFKKINYTYNYSDLFYEFRKKYKFELEVLKELGLIYHSNSRDYDSYIRYSLTILGNQLIKNGL